MTFKVDLDILSVDRHAKIQGCMSVRLDVRARLTDDAKYISPITDMGCKNEEANVPLNGELLFLTSVAHK